MQREFDATRMAVVTLAAIKRRPIPVYIIFTFCTLQFVAICSTLIQGWDEVTYLVRNGVESAPVFIGKLMYPTILFLAGVALVWMKRIATYLFAVYLAIGIIRVVMQPATFAPYLSLAIIAGIVVYCFRMKQQGQLA